MLKKILFAVLLFICITSITNWALYNSWNVGQKNNKDIGKLDGWYGNKDNSIYYHWKVLEWVDMNSFKVVNCIDEYKTYCIWKDQKYFYFKNKQIAENDQDIQLLNWWYCIVIDKKEIYCSDGNYQISFISIIDANSFKNIKWDIYADKNHVFQLNESLNYSERILSSNPKTFTFLNDKYIINNESVQYKKYKIKEIVEADIETFSVFQKWESIIKNEYAKDKNNVYFLGEVIPWVSPIWFSVDKYQQKELNKEYSLIYLIMLVTFIGEFLIILGLYNNLVKKKNIWFSIKKQLWIIVPTLLFSQILLGYLLDWILDYSKIFIIYLSVIGIIIMVITNILKPKSVNILKEGIILWLSIVIIRVVLAFILVFLMSLFY